MEKRLRRLQHTLYIKANKPDTFLAMALCIADYTPKPIRLKLTKDSYSSNTNKILHGFRRPLSTLYNESTTLDQPQLDDLLSSISLSSLSSTNREALELPITVDSILTVMKS